MNHDGEELEEVRAFCALKIETQQAESQEVTWNYRKNSEIMKERHSVLRSYRIPPKCPFKSTGNANGYISFNMMNIMNWSNKMMSSKENYMIPFRIKILPFGWYH